MWKKLFLLALLLCFATSSYAIVSGQTTFTNGLETEEIIFTNYENITRFLEVATNLYLENLTITAGGINDSRLQYDKFRFINQLGSSSGCQLAFGIAGFSGLNGTGENVFIDNLDSVSFWPGVNAGATEDEWTYSAGYSDINLTNLSVLNPQTYVLDGDNFCRDHQYIQFNLTKNVSALSFGVGTRPNDNVFRLRDFSINVSRDGETWTEILNASFDYPQLYLPAGSPSDEAFYFDTIVGVQYPENFTISTRSRDNITYASDEILILNETRSFSLAPDGIRDIIDKGCDCYNCSLSGRLCSIPITFTSFVNSTAFYDNINVTYSKEFNLINEKTGEAFDVTNITGVKLYADNNNSFFDFQASSTNTSNVTIEYNKYRLELEYSDGTIITRYIDTDLADNPVRLCANNDGVTHFEQLIISTSESAALLRSTFADCYVAADYTRFGYQDAYVLKAFTIPTQYQLSTLDGTEEIILIGLDGSIASFVNIDTLQFRQQTFDTEILSDDLVFSRTGDTTIAISYENRGALNSAAALTITRLDSDVVVSNIPSFSNPNQFTTYFDYSTLTGVNDTTMFQAELTKTNSEGTSTIRTYFNTFAKTGIISSAMAAIISVLLVVFGFTFTLARSALSYFGIVVILTALFVLSMGAPVWYITFLYAVYGIILIYTVIIMANQNKQTLA